MPTEFICGCGTGLPAKSCHGKLDRGRRKILPYQWHLRAPVGFDVAHQSKVATYLARTNLGLVLHTGLPDLTIEQPQELVPRDVELIHTIPILATEDGRVINSIPHSYFWYHPSHVARTTPNVNCLTKSNMNELVSGYSSALKPVENVTRNSDNITMVVQHFFRQFPNGSVDFIGKPFGAMQRIALCHSAAHWTMFEYPEVVENLRRSPGESPMLNALAQTSVLPFETLLKQRTPRGFIIDWVDHGLVFWLGEDVAVQRRAFEESVVLSPWRGNPAQFDLDLSTALYRQFFIWLVGATNDMYRFLLDGGRFAGNREPARQWLYDYLIYLEIVNLVHEIMNSTSPFARMELFMRLAYNIVSRQHPSSPSHIFDLPFSPRAREIKATLCSSTMPQSLRDHLWTQWQELANHVESSFAQNILPAFRPLTAGKNTRFQNLSATEYIGRYLEALRHSTHGFNPYRGSDKGILFTHTGLVPDDLPYLAFFWWIKILINQEWVFVPYS